MTAEMTPLSTNLDLALAINKFHSILVVIETDFSPESSSHRTKSLHSCTKENIPENNTEYKGPTGFTCSLSSCSNRELTEIICGHCQQSFCLSHRHAQDHSCPKWEDPAKESHISKTAEHVNNIIASKPFTSKAPKKLRGGAKSSKTAAKLALMKMKMHAQGDKGCPQEERVYTCVCLPVRCKLDAVPMFFSKMWSIGRVVDSIADRLGLKNDNNIQNAQKLRMFSTTNGAMFQTDTQLETLIKEETIYNGSSVILEYVGNGCVELEDWTCYKIT